VRAAQISDAPGMADVLNPIIQAGGTTALETELSPEDLAHMALRSPSHICCHVAEDGEGRIVGFQWLDKNPKLPPDMGDIATFARLHPKLPGVGRALFAATLEAACEAGLSMLNATIRADNTGGLTYYGKMGFAHHANIPGVPLKDGTPVDRVMKRRTV
jgi:L-amino acid N-acyltransferase YncA